MGLRPLTDLTASIQGLVRRTRTLGRQSYLPQLTRARISLASVLDNGPVFNPDTGDLETGPISPARNEPGDAPVPSDDPRVIASEERQREQVTREAGNESGLTDVSSPSWLDFQRIAFLVLGVLFVVIGLTLLAVPKAETVSDVLDIWTKYELGRGARLARKSGVLDGGAARIIDNGPNLAPPDRGGDNPDGRNDPRPDFGGPVFEGEVVTADEIKRRGSLSGPGDDSPQVFTETQQKPLGRTKQKRVKFPDNSKPKPSKKKQAKDVSDAVGETFSEWTNAARDASKATIKAGPLTPPPPPKPKLKPPRKEVDNRKVAPPANKAQSRKPMNIFGKSAEHQIFSFPWGKRPARALPFEVKKD